MSTVLISGRSPKRTSSSKEYGRKQQLAGQRRSEKTYRLCIVENNQQTYKLSQQVRRETPDWVHFTETPLLPFLSSHHLAPRHIRLKTVSLVFSTPMTYFKWHVTEKLQLGLHIKMPTQSNRNFFPQRFHVQKKHMEEKESWSCVSPISRSGAVVCTQMASLKWGEPPPGPRICQVHTT